MSKKNETSEIRMHRWFGTVIKEVLTPLGLEVLPGHPVMVDPPVADVVIIRKKEKAWTREQLEYLPEGVRDSKTAHVIIEFKNTESLTDDSLFITGAYGVFYKRHKKLKDRDVQVFIASAKTPSRKTLEKYGYMPSNKAGIYRGNHNPLKILTLISLNELANEPYNALYRLFGSRKKEKIKALTWLLHDGIAALPEKIIVFILRIARLLLRGGGEENMGLSPEEKSLFSEFLNDVIIPNMPPEDLFKNVKERLEGVPVKKWLEGVPLKEMLEGHAPEEIEEYLKTLKRNQ